MQNAVIIENELKAEQAYQKRVNNMDRRTHLLLNE